MGISVPISNISSGYKILEYCDICLSSVGSTLGVKLERNQKRAARVVLREGSVKDPVSQLQGHPTTVSS